MRSFAFMLLVAVPVFAAPVPKEAKKDDLTLFEGVWWEARFNATNNPNEAEARRFSFNKDGSAGIHQTAGAKPFEYTFSIDQTTTPPRFTWKGKGGESYNAIYRLDGDTLFIVFTESKKPIPKEVKYGSGDVYYELKRVK